MITTTTELEMFELTTVVVIGTDCTGSCKFNYLMITTTSQQLNWQSNIPLVKLWNGSDATPSFRVNSSISYQHTANQENIHLQRFTCQCD